MTRKSVPGGFSPGKKKKKEEMRKRFVFSRGFFSFLCRTGESTRAPGIGCVQPPLACSGPIGAENSILV